MIRFVDLSDDYWVGDKEEQDEPGPFAFLSTVTDQFCEFCGEQVWQDAEDFKDCFEEDAKEEKELGSEHSKNELQRFLSLVPDEFWKSKRKQK